MSWIEPISTALTGASLANDLANKSITLKHMAKRILAQIRHGKIVLPIFGAGGAGKSTAGRVLTSKDPFNARIPYEESWEVELLKLPGVQPGCLLVAPGQIDRIPRYWPELIQKANSGAALGVVNVVSYGYHSFMIPTYKDHELYEPDMAPFEFTAVYTSHRRRVELELLEHLVNQLAPVKGKFFMITVVTKQDLWWNAKSEVRSHYEKGEYAQKIRRLVSRIGNQNFQHEFLPVSLTLTNLRTPNGELLAPVCEGYDHLVHIQHLEAFLSRLYELAISYQKKKRHG